MGVKAASDNGRCVFTLLDDNADADADVSEVLDTAEEDPATTTTDDSVDSDAD